MQKNMGILTAVSSFTIFAIVFPIVCSGEQCLFYIVIIWLFLLKWYSILLFVKQTRDAMVMESGKWYANWTTRIGRSKSSIHWSWRKWWRHQDRWRTLCPKSHNKCLRFHWQNELYSFVQIISRKRKKDETMWTSRLTVNH